MLFTSPVFLIFFALVFVFCRIGLPWRVKKTILLLASYLFYAAWNPPFVALLWLSTGVDWVVASRIHRSDQEGRRKALLIVSLCVNLGVLAAFKYANFLSESFLGLANLAGWGFELPPCSIILPIGIIFFPFQPLPYTIDIFRGS